MYTNDKSTLILIALLKQYGIKNIVVSPGMRNSVFSYSVQQDKFFKVYSVVDERSAGYFATGLAYELNEPVVITCTGATASRNYLSALTEAYNRGLPVIAVTGDHETANKYTLTPQYVDRSVSQNDVKTVSVFLPKVIDEQSQSQCELLCNVALSSALSKRGGPVHINLATLDWKFTEKTLPKVHKINSYDTDDLYNSETAENLAVQLCSKKVGLFIGAHKKMTAKQLEAISSFVKAVNAAVFTDQTSNYQGPNQILIGQALDVSHIKSMPDILIDMGSICGQYSIAPLFKKSTVWRISEDGVIKQRHGILSCFFDCKEETFFREIGKHVQNIPATGYYQEVCRELKPVNMNILPLSNVFVSGILSEKLPPNSNLHLSILNSLRSMNLFPLDKTINGSCNVGGFGIDGPVSTLVGQSVADKKRLYFAVVGDLAFFYDMNILGNRHIGKNVRILLLNNGLGVEFRLNAYLQAFPAEEINRFVAAAGHNGSAKGWAESMGFRYISAASKADFLAQVDDFCSPDISKFDAPVLFEVFVKPEDDVFAYKHTAAPKKKTSGVVKAVSCLIPNKELRRKFRSKHSR